MNAQNTPGTAENKTSSLCPIPRTGLTGSSGIILHILLVLAATMIGLGVCTLSGSTAVGRTAVEVIAVVTALLLLTHLWRVCRPSKGILPLIVLVLAFIAFLEGSLVTAAALAALIFAIGEGSLLLAVLSKKQAVWFPLVPIAAYVLTAVITRDLVGAAACLVPFPPMLVLAWGTRNSAEKQDGLTRVGVICITSLAFGLSAAAVLALFLYQSLGTLEPAALLEALETYRSELITALTSIELPENATDELKELMSRDNVENMVNGMFNLLPGYVVVIVNLITAVSQLIQQTGLRTFGFGDSVTDRVKAFRMSLISCIVFVIAYFTVLFSDTTASTLVGTVAENIYTILMPGLALAGLLRIVTGLTKRGVGGYGCLFYFIILVPCLLIFSPFLLAVVEVIGHIFTAITSRLKPPSDDSGSFGNPPDHH